MLFYSMYIVCNFLLYKWTLWQGGKVNLSKQNTFTAVSLIESIPLTSCVVTETGSEVNSPIDDHTAIIKKQAVWGS